MVAHFLKRVAAQFPETTQHELRRLFFRRQIRGSRFATNEQEYKLLDRFIGTGDWALDIGANVGHYAMRMSELVGATGRVLAFEPVPDTFALLAANARLFPFANVSLFNVAASDRTASVGIKMPRFSEGLINYYQAQLTSEPTALTIVGLPIDALSLPVKVKLVKIDVEGHELPVLRGMQHLLERDHPVLIVETSSDQVVELLEGLGYASERLPGSSNLLSTFARRDHL